MQLTRKGSKYMMINKRLIGEVGESKKYIAGNVILQWCSLVANIVMMTSITGLLAGLHTKTAGGKAILATAIVGVIASVIRVACATGAARM